MAWKKNKISRKNKKTIMTRVDYINELNDLIDHTYTNNEKGNEKEKSIICEKEINYPYDEPEILDVMDEILWGWDQNFQRSIK